MRAPRISLGPQGQLRIAQWLAEHVPDLTAEQRGKVVFMLVVYATETVCKSPRASNT